MKISTSVLNSKDRIEDVIKLNRTNTSYIHVDVMDGKFVDDVQFKINEISAVNMVTKYPLDVHLMVNDPIKYIIELKDMNIEYITFHLEIRRSKEKIISKIKELGYKVGISIKPDTDIEKLQPYLKDIDLVLIMSVEPGEGGQAFLDGTVDRINELKKLIDAGGYNVEIEVDGGINNITISKLQNVDIAVVGSYIIKSNNYYMQIEELLKLTNSIKNNKDGKGYDINKVKKKIILYRILLFIGLLPFVFLVSLEIYNAIFGFCGLCFISCMNYFGFSYWTFLVLELLLFIISAIKIKKYMTIKKTLG